MAWELLAIWTIVIVTTVWFMRDERRQRDEKLEARARHFALAPSYRHKSPDFVPLPLPSAETMSEARRRFIEGMKR